MAEKHLDHLFSAAYDGELDPAGRRRLDAHLEGCERCAAAWDDYRAALDAVRALPAVAMPAIVRLPVGPPHVEAGRAARLDRLHRVLLHPQPLWAAAGLAAVSLAAVVLAVHHPGGGGSANSPGGVAFSQAQGGALHQAPALVPQVVAPVPCPVSPVPGPGAAPAGFTHSAQTEASTGGRLVIATRSDRYAPGASVPIYARLTGVPASAGGSDVIPCVTLETAGGSAANGAPAPLAAPAPPGPGREFSSTIAPTPLAVATSQPQSLSAAGSGSEADSAKSASAGPLLTLTIPPNVPRGTVLRLVAVIPPGYSGNPGTTPIQVVLVITVG